VLFISSIVSITASVLSRVVSILFSSSSFSSFTCSNRFFVSSFVCLVTLLLFASSDSTVSSNFGININLESLPASSRTVCEFSFLFENHFLEFGVSPPKERFDLMLLLVLYDISSLIH